eukprot:TRINITY_DN7900_c0_g1_i1.p1 TRINITY_DN7900_c0_g1~~TRINITY_DN7900_c0_g1_i1.p1  ORF type:complete len:205 (+),score=37.39 TRINITY_DN7900_c0_g1_i1:101-715(+)
MSKRDSEMSLCSLSRTSSVDTAAFHNTDGLCAVRAACAKAGKTRASELSKEVKDKLEEIEKRGSLIPDDIKYVFEAEGAYPNGDFQVTQYTTFPDLLRFVALTGDTSVVSLGEGNLAKGCTKDGRYCASFKVKPDLSHLVCLQKEGNDVKIVDTFIQEKLEADGALSTDKGEEFLFTVDEYLNLLKQSGVTCDGTSEVYGNPGE